MQGWHWWVLSVLLAVSLWVIPERAVADDIPDPAPGCTVHTLDAPCMELPEGMAAGVSAVVECESHFNPNAVGKLGERGLLQLHPRHAEPMAVLYGLDWTVEADRWEYARALWTWHGWGPWSCRP
jgi:hypothetical protein